MLFINKGFNMIRLLLLSICLLLGISNLANANECKIDSSVLALNKGTMDLTFRNNISKGLDLYTPIPIGSIVASDGVVLIQKNENLVGVFTVKEKFITKGTIEKTIQDAYNYDCSEPILNINKPDYKIYIIEQKGTLDDRPRTTAFVLTDKYKDLFYLISFTGFSKNEAVQMLTTK